MKKKIILWNIREDNTTYLIKQTYTHMSMKTKQKHTDRKKTINSYLFWLKKKS